MADRWGELTGTITRGGRRKAGFEVKNLECPSRAAGGPADPKSSPPPASYTKFPTARDFS